MTSLLLALLAGALSTLSPCVLPILPILLSSAAQINRFGVVGLLGGVALAYAIVGSALAIFGASLPFDPQTLRDVGAVLMLAFGAALLFERLQALLTGMLRPLTARANERVATGRFDGVAGQALLGAMLGVVWAPCTGPTLGAAVALAATGDALWKSVSVMTAFSLGATLPMAALAYGSRSAVGARKQWLIAIGTKSKKLMGVALVVVGTLVITRQDKALETLLLQRMPSWMVDLSTRF